MKCKVVRTSVLKISTCWLCCNSVSQGQDKTQEVLNWIGRNPTNTVAKLREILVEMRRDDCVEIIDKKYC